MKCIRIFGYVLLVLLFISTVPYAAEARNVKIYPDQFKPVNPSDPHNLQSSSYLYGDGGDATYYAVVKLPVGTRVTRVVLFHSSDSVAGTSCLLYRFQFGAAVPYDRTMASFFCTGNTGNAATAVAYTTISYPKVRSGFRYWVKVDVGNGNRLHGVKVVYE